MRARVDKIIENRSKYGGHFYYIFFTDLDGNKFKTCVGRQFRNYDNWDFVLQPGFKAGTILDGLELSKRERNLIDADSVPRIASICGESITPITRHEQPDLFSFAKAKEQLREARAALR